MLLNSYVKIDFERIFHNIIRSTKIARHLCYVVYNLTVCKTPQTDDSYNRKPPERDYLPVYQFTRHRSSVSDSQTRCPSDEFLMVRITFRRAFVISIVTVCQAACSYLQKKLYPNTTRSESELPESIPQNEAAAAAPTEMVNGQKCAQRRGDLGTENSLPWTRTGTFWPHLSTPNNAPRIAADSCDGWDYALCERKCEFCGDKHLFCIFRISSFQF